jgi:dolichol kinase
MAAFAQESGQLALELHRLLAELDRSRFRWREMVRAQRTRLIEVRAHLAELASRRETGVLHRKVVELQKVIDESAPTTEQRADWLSFRAQVMPTYEAFAALLRKAEIHVPSLRPKNYLRNVYHVANASTCIALLEFAPWWFLIGLSSTAAVLAWTMELARSRSPRLNAWFMTKLFAKVAHPHEGHRVNSATWFATAIAVLAMTQQLLPCLVALITLGVGDPLAAIVGRRWGRVRWFHGRSVEGTLTFATSAALAGALYVHGVHGGTWPHAITLALGGAILGAVAELLSHKLDDNLTVPLAAWLGAFGASLLV